jgi:ribosomal protein L24
MLNFSRFRFLFFLFFMVFSPSVPAFADIVVDTVDELVSAVNSTQSGGDRTILLADGNYQLDGHYLRIVVNGVTVRSQSGKRANVILDGNYQTTEIFQIVASDVTIADLTLKRARDHPVHVMGGSSQDVENTLVSNVHIVDPGEQAIKINPSGDYAAHFGTIQNSLIELTASGRDFVENDTSNGHPCYTGGIDAHGAAGWTVQDNEIRGFWCSTGLSEHGVHFWSDSSATVVQRNLIIDCARGIGFGLGSSGHSEGIIRNNMISHGEALGVSDVGISLESASAAQVYNNTIFHEHDYPNAIEYRFPASNSLIIVNNLTNRAITSRDDGTATQLAANISSAAADWFTDAAGGDLHLRGERSGVTGAALPISGLEDDFDRQDRPLGTGPDIGADEYSPGVPPPRPDGQAGLSWLFLLLGR